MDLGLNGQNVAKLAEEVFNQGREIVAFLQIPEARKILAKLLWMSKDSAILIHAPNSDLGAHGVLALSLVEEEIKPGIGNACHMMIQSFRSEYRSCIAAVSLNKAKVVTPISARSGQNGLNGQLVLSLVEGERGRKLGKETLHSHVWLQKLAKQMPNFHLNVFTW